jgi:chromate reductase
MAPYKVAILVGSLRRGSFSRLTAHALIGLAPPTLAPGLVEIRALSLYDQDLDHDPPGPWTAFRQAIQATDGVLFVTPEYNRSVPGALKNALDIGSRPYGNSVWNGKPGAIVSVSPGALGGFGANHHLRQSLVFLNVPAMQQPEAYIGGAATLFDSEGLLASDSTRDFLRTFMARFGEWVAANARRAG